MKMVEIEIKELINEVKRIQERIEKLDDLERLIENLISAINELKDKVEETQMMVRRIMKKNGLF